MDPEKISDEQNKRIDALGLHAEGIDLIGSSIALDNEFSTPEESAAPAQPTAVPKAEVKPQPAIKPPAPKMPAPLPYTMPEKRKDPIQNDPSIKPLRTFKSDAEEAVKYGNVSKITIAVAEQKRRETSTPVTRVEEKRSRPGLYLIFVGVAIIALGGGWYYWFNASSPVQEKIAAPQVAIEAIIPYSKASLVVLAPGSDPIALIAAKLRATSATVGNVTALAPVSNATASSIAPLSDVISGTHIPSRLLRSLSSDYMVGSYAYDVESPFIILKDTFFQNAFSGMLDWEKDLGADMAPLIQVSDPTVSSSMAIGAKFEDGVVSNVDVRVLKDASGKVLLAYAFADKDTIVITTSANALKYILDRVLQVRTIQ